MFEGADGVELRAPPGMKVGEIPTPKTVGSDVPGGGGILSSPGMGELAAAIVRGQPLPARACALGLEPGWLSPSRLTKG